MPFCQISGENTRAISGIRWVPSRTLPFRARRGLIGASSALDPEKCVSVPVRTGDRLGNGGERFVSPAIQCEPFVEDHHRMSGVLPLPDELSARFDLDPAERAGAVAIANGISNFAQPPLRCRGKTSVGSNLHLVSYGPGHEPAPQRFWRGMSEQQFPAPAQLVMAEIRQTRDLGLQDCIIAFTPGHRITPGVAFYWTSRLSNHQFDRFERRRSSPRAGEVSASCARYPRGIL